MSNYQTIKIDTESGTNYSSEEVKKELGGFFGVGKEIIAHNDQEMMIHDDKYTINLYRNYKLLGHCYSIDYAMEIIKYEMVQQIEENRKYKLEVSENKQKVKFSVLNEGYLYNTYTLLDRFEMQKIPKLNLIPKLTDAESETELEVEKSTYSDINYNEVFEKEEESEKEETEDESDSDSSYDYDSDSDYSYESETESETESEPTGSILMNNSLYKLLANSI